MAGVGRRVYLDDAGSAPILSEVRTARLRAPAGNPSSIHTEGREARAALDAARDRAGRALAVDPAGLVFCGSGTEAVNLALLGAGRRLASGRSVVTWAAEHQSVLGAARRLTLDGLPVEVLPVDPHDRREDDLLASLQTADELRLDLSHERSRAPAGRGGRRSRGRRPPPRCRSRP